ncbi:MAG: helix-turn-helix domain-containing protein [Acidimicrobiales bacterium]
MARAGRPRRFEEADELRLLLDAGLVVMERNGYQDAAVADILAEADLSTRSFYRHFESKDQLLCALYRREAEAAA